MIYKSDNTLAQGIAECEFFLDQGLITEGEYEELIIELKSLLKDEARSEEEINLEEAL